MSKHSVQTMALVYLVSSSSPAGFGRHETDSAQAEDRVRAGRLRVSIPDCKRCHPLRARVSCTSCTQDTAKQEAAKHIVQEEGHCFTHARTFSADFLSSGWTASPRRRKKEGWR